MPKYIDANRLFEIIAYCATKQKLESHSDNPSLSKETFAIFCDGIINIVAAAIAETPTADVAKVVRCKECKLRYTETCFSKHETADNDFCSCGARMDGDE